MYEELPIWNEIMLITLPEFRTANGVVKSSDVDRWKGDEVQEDRLRDDMTKLKG